MKRIPYGVIDYKSLVEEDYIYVDKTMYLSELENERKTLVYLKPGRFGKSLFTSMLRYYYDVNSESDFETLFKGTYVYDNPTPNKNNYYVLKFDFSGLTTANMTEDEMKDSFNKKVLDGINEFLGYGFDIKIDETTKEPNILLLSLLTDLRRLNKEGKLEHKVYILVDEYDNFTNGILDGDASLFKNVVNHNGFVKSFYAVIKEYVGLGVVDRFFATGICPITLNSMTTGFNIATDISTRPEYNSMVGLTHEEVKWLFKELNLSKEEQDKVFNLMISQYDGYRFSENTDERIFNATLVMYFLSEYIRDKQIPKKLYDNNIVVNYGKIDNLLRLQDNKFYKEIISDILDNGEITGILKTQFNLAEDFVRDDIISLLYYFGYLTIKTSDITGQIIFKIPNLVMKETYGNYFIKLIRDENVEIDTTIINEGLREILLSGRIDKLTNYIENILESLDNRMFIKFDERYIQELYFALLANNPVVSVYTEYPCSNGYIDIYMKGKREKIKYEIMIELKYIKKSDYNDILLESKKEEAKKQIEEYSKDDRIDKENLKKYIVIFVGNELKTLTEI